VRGEKIGLRGLGQGFGLLGFAFLLKAQQLGHFFFAASGEAPFLNLQIAKFLFVLAADFHFGEDGGDGIVVFGVAGDPLVADEDEEGHFGAGDAVETPAAIDDRLHEGAFFDADGLQEFLVFDKQSLVRSGFFGREKDGAAGEPCFDGVERDFGFAFGAGRPGTVLGVGAIGGELGVGEFGTLGGLGSLLLDGAAKRIQT